jgi:hypothetical protein
MQTYAGVASTENGKTYGVEFTADEITALTTVLADLSLHDLTELCKKRAFIDANMIAAGYSRIGSVYEGSRELWDPMF